MHPKILRWCATENVYICHEICTFSYHRWIYTSKYKLLCHRFGGRMMVFCCCFWLFNYRILLVIHSPNFQMFLTVDFCIILSIVFFWCFFSFENMASSEDRRVSLEDAVAFVTAGAVSDFSSDFSEEEEDSS